MSYKVRSEYCGGLAEKFFKTKDEAIQAIRAMGAVLDSGNRWVAKDMDEYGNEAYFYLVPLC